MLNPAGRHQSLLPDPNARLVTAAAFLLALEREREKERKSEGEQRERGRLEGLDGRRRAVKERERGDRKWRRAPQKAGCGKQERSE